MINDPFHALCRFEHVDIPGIPNGSLTGLTFAAKDNLDVAGHRTASQIGRSIIAISSNFAVAQKLQTPPALFEPFRLRALKLCRRPDRPPQATLEDCPLGLSILGPRSADTKLMELAANFEYLRSIYRS